jgi:arylsulfatase A-like enzyme
MKPNILFIVMDDLGSNDLGLHGSGIKTPISDSLAREGLYLNNYYVLPTCTMTRIALMTGRYPYRMGQYDVIRAPQERGMPVDEETLPQVLRRAGYQTHAIGKWHLGHAKYEQLPTFRGFKSFFGFHVGGAQDYFSHISRNDAYDMRWEKHEFCGEDCSEIVDERGNYSSHIFGREAVRVINDHESSTGPLFLYLAFQAVHFPLEVPDEYVELYDDTNWDTTRKYYAGMLTAADEAIGQVKLAMEKRGLWKDTLVVFTTDNGGAVKGTVIKGTDRRERGQVASNYPYRGGKKDVWEGGVAGDGFISGPAMQSLAMLHGKSDGLFHAVDWLPTLADLSGVLQIGKPMDGVSQLQALRKGDTARNTTFLGYSAQPPYNTTENSFTAVRQGKWKLVREPNREIFNLFDLETDPEERQDLSASFPWIVTHLQKSMEDFESLFSPSVESFDERCPTLSFTNTSWGQKSWHPWCG